MQKAPCPYGDECKRRDPAHWVEQTHPTMTIKELPAIPCKFGWRCSNLDSLHRHLYTHYDSAPAAPSPVPATKPTPVKKTPPVKKRKEEGAPAPLHVMKDGDTVEMESSSSAETKYVVRFAGGNYYCSCPGWKFQSTPINKRTCPHLQAHLGKEFEEKRCGTLVASKKVKTKEENLEKPCLLLAEKFDPSKTDPVGWWISEKLDGVRAFWCPTAGKLISRLGNAFHAPDWFLSALPKTHQLDGELFLGRGKFSETISIVRSFDAGDRWKDILYHVFDVPSLKSHMWEDRLSWMQANLAGITSVTLVEQKKCVSMEQLKKEMDAVTALGGEGLMIRQPKSLYIGKRSSTLQKIKEFHDAEATVLSHIGGKGKHKNRMGALHCRLEDGTEFDVGTGFTDAERDSPPAVGSKITFRYFELTRDLIPRFPSFVRVASDI